MPWQRKFPGSGLSCLQDISEGHALGHLDTKSTWLGHVPITCKWLLLGDWSKMRVITQCGSDAGGVAVPHLAQPTHPGGFGHAPGDLWSHLFGQAFGLKSLQHGL